MKKDIYYFYLKLKNYLEEREINSTLKINIMLGENKNILVFYIGDKLICTNLKKTCFGNGIKIGKSYYDTFELIVPKDEEIENNDF